jgi:hypothetical protein
VRVTTAGGSAIAALGDTTAKAKAKSGRGSAVAAKVDVSPPKSPKVKTAAKKSPKAKSVAAKATAGTTRVAKRLEAQASLKVASATKRTGGRNRVAASSGGIRAVAYQASSLPARRALVASNAHPYAILGTTPGFMKPARSRRAGSGLSSASQQSRSGDPFQAGAMLGSRRREANRLVGRASRGPSL